ncbi:MAG TPA: response regulator [Pyrinomonadaceae bacterium]|nr:response regulator [Pyrinomonadaceae bacterium]
MNLRTENTTVRTISEALFPALLKPARVLVVDDDPITAALLSTVAKREGYQVVSLRDGREAYRILKSNADFTAAVFNMTMPHLHGVDLVRHMKTEKRLMRIPVVIVAGEHGLKLITDSFAAGALAFLPKPLTTEKLAQTVRLAIGSQAARKQSYELGKMAA